jgi:hypothetical protein
MIVKLSNVTHPCTVQVDFPTDYTWIYNTPHNSSLFKNEKSTEFLGLHTVTVTDGRTAVIIRVPHQENDISLMVLHKAYKAL